MSESTLSNQVTRLLTRFEQKLSIPPTCAADQAQRVLVPQKYIKAAATLNEKKLATGGESSRTLKSLQAIYEASFKKSILGDAELQDSGQYSRSKTPEQTNLIQKTTQNRPNTPILNKSSTQLPSNPSKFQPKLNKNSLKIASKLTNAKDRLTASSTPKLLPNDESFTYKPTINKKSQRILSKHPEKVPRWEGLYSKSKEKHKEYERIRAENEEKEEKEVLNCSFRPNILQPSLNINPSETVERLTVWAKNREQKIREKKENEAEKSLKECTFMPKISEIQNFPEQLTDIKGVGPYIQRGKMLKTSAFDDTFTVQPAFRDINKKKYNELVEALHNELQSLEL